MLEYLRASSLLRRFKIQLRKSQRDLVAEGPSLGGVMGFGEAASNASEDLPKAVRITNSLGVRYFLQKCEAEAGVIARLVPSQGSGHCKQ